MSNDAYSRAGRQTSGWAVGFILFAAIMMIMVGVFQAFQGLVAIFENEFYVATRNYLFQFDATTWGWIHLLVGLIVAFAGWGLLSGRTWARPVRGTGCLPAATLMGRRRSGSRTCCSSSWTSGVARRRLRILGRCAQCLPAAGEAVQPQPFDHKLRAAGHTQAATIGGSRSESTSLSSISRYHAVKHQPGQHTITQAPLPEICQKLRYA